MQVSGYKWPVQVSGYGAMCWAGLSLHADPPNSLLLLAIYPLQLAIFCRAIHSLIIIREALIIGSLETRLISNDMISRERIIQ